MSRIKLSSGPDPSLPPLPDPPTGELILITVGGSAIPFEVHKSLLEKHSPFFVCALNGRFMESDSRVINLPDDDPKTFAEFVSWLYSSCLFTSTPDPAWLQLSQLWVLADKLCIHRLQNEIMCLFPRKYDRIGGNISPTTIRYVFSHTVHPSALRRIIIDICAWGMYLPDLRMFAEILPRDFVASVYYVLMDLQSKNIQTSTATSGQPFKSKEGMQQYLVDEKGRPGERSEAVVTPLKMDKRWDLKKKHKVH